MTPVELDDLQIMRRVQAGEVELFDLLVERYRGPLLNVAWSKLGNRTWAEDVVQEAFLAGFASRATYNPQFAFRTWLWSILLNLCRRHWQRRESRPREHSLPRAGDTHLAGYREPATYESAPALLLRVESRAEVHQLLGRLPEVQADALRLRFFGGLQYAEIALAMDSSLGAAKQRVKNGLAALANRLRENEGEVT
jgi:RNA polymerase sigma-70 factor, ECF subfamily